MPTTGSNLHDADDMKELVNLKLALPIDSVDCEHLLASLPTQRSGSASGYRNKSLQSTQLSGLPNMSPYCAEALLSFPDIFGRDQF